MWPGGDEEELEIDERGGDREWDQESAVGLGDERRCWPRGWCLSPDRPGSGDDKGGTSSSGDTAWGVGRLGGLVTGDSTSRTDRSTAWSG